MRPWTGETTFTEKDGDDIDITGDLATAAKAAKAANAAKAYKAAYSNSRNSIGVIEHKRSGVTPTMNARPVGRAAHPDFANCMDNFKRERFGDWKDFVGSGVERLKPPAFTGSCLPRQTFQESSARRSVQLRQASFANSLRPQWSVHRGTSWSWLRRSSVGNSEPPPFWLKPIRI